jgi:PAS domain S-box-containing protein
MCFLKTARMPDRPASAVETAALLAAIVQSTDDAIISTDATGILRSWNRAAENLYGYRACEALGRPNRLIIPADRFDEEDEVVRRVLGGQNLPSFETVRVRRDGTRVDVYLTASAIRHPDGRIVGISKISRDITGRKRSDEIRREALEASRRLAIVVESSDDAIVTKDLNGIVRSWNPAAERMFGYTADEAIGRSIRLIIPSGREDEEISVLDRVARGERIDHYETIRRRKDGVEVPISLTVSPIRNEHGVVIGASKIARDITERKRSEEARERDHRRAAFLGQIAETLSESLDYDETLKRVVTLAVPAIADWCAVDVVQDDGEIARLAVAHRDRAKIELGTEVRRRYEDPTAPYAVQQVVRTATPALISDITDEMVVAAANGDQERVALVRSLGLRSYLCVPLVTSGGTVGALTLATAESGRRYTEDDLRFAQDIAYRAALGVENARSYEQLRRANRFKDEFLATLSHELRTPLTAILGYARMGTDGIVTGEKLTQALQTIERNATVLTQMVEDMLDVSRIVAGKMRLNVQPVELPLIIREAIETIKPAADAKRIKVQAVIDPQVGPISGDPDRLRQIVWNLLSNSVKFTPKEGHVQIRLERINSNVEITISDTGIGIDAGFLPHVFERFRQADAGSTRQQAGLGLGLAIVRNLVDLHGGTVSASSGGPGTGTTFRVTLPVMIVQTAPIEEKRVHPRHERARSFEGLQDLTGTHVFAVDNEPDALALLIDILESAGARVTTATTGAAALERIHASKPDVVLADLGMPLMDGFEFIQRLRQSSDRVVRETPAAVLTAYGRSEDRARSLQEGFEMHLAKPIDPVELASAVKALARRRRFGEAQDG